MAEPNTTTDAVAIAHARYIEGDPAREESLETERLEAETARLRAVLDMLTGNRPVERLRRTLQDTEPRRVPMVRAGAVLHAISRIERLRAENQRLTEENRLLRAKRPTVETCFFAFKAVCCIDHGLLEGKACNPVGCDDYSPDG